MDAAADDYQKIFLPDLLNRLLRHTASMFVVDFQSRNVKRLPCSATALVVVYHGTSKLESVVHMSQRISIALRAVCHLFVEVHRCILWRGMVTFLPSISSDKISCFLMFLHFGFQ